MSLTLQAQSELSARLDANINHDIHTACGLLAIFLAMMAMFCIWTSDLIIELIFNKTSLTLMRKNLVSVVENWPVLQNVFFCVNQLALICQRFSYSNNNEIGTVGYLLAGAKSHSFRDKVVTLRIMISLPPQSKKSLVRRCGSF